MKKQKSKDSIAEEWDMREGMGILPNDIPFTQNIGCVGGKTKKPESQASKPENKK